MNEEVTIHSTQLPSLLARNDFQPALVEVRDDANRGGIFLVLCVLVGSGYYAGRLSLLGALAVVAIAAVIMLVLWYKSASKEVWVYKEGVLAQRQSSIWKLNEMDWYQLPWDNIVHIDLTGKEFSVLYVGSKLTRGPHHFKTMSKAERKRVIDELRSFQQRGDIPATVRILDK